MNRRDFIRNVCGLALGAVAAPLLPLATADAASNREGIPIAETRLQFGPMDTRFITNAIVIHHIGNTNADVPAAEVHRWHLANGWSGIGYHYVIRKDGTIERGRPREAVGAHALGQNKHTLGINIVGNFETAYPTQAQLDSASVLMAALCSLYGISPSFSTIMGHRDLNETACPGRNLYAELPILIHASATKMKDFPQATAETHQRLKTRHHELTPQKEKYSRHAKLYH